MFHVELRKFPQNTHLFNLEAGQLRVVILEPWTRGDVFDVGGHRWLPQLTTLTVLEGPELEPNELSLGRGWPAATRRSTDVTELVLSQMTSAPAVTAPPPVRIPPAPPPAALASILLARCAVTTLGLHEAWCVAAAGALRGRRPSETLAGVEDAIVELLEAGLVELRRGQDPLSEGEQSQTVLYGLDAWRPGGEVMVGITPAGRVAIAQEDEA